MVRADGTVEQLAVRENVSASYVVIASFNRASLQEIDLTSEQVAQFTEAASGKTDLCMYKLMLLPSNWEPGSTTML